MSGIKIENGTILFYGNAVGYISKGRAEVDLMFQGDELSEFLARQWDVREVKWTDGVFDQLMNGQREPHEIQLLKNCRVWQLKSDVDIHIKFISYNDMVKQHGPPDPDNYQVVYDGAVDTNDLEGLYEKFRANEHPPGYTGYPLSISDVVELYDVKANDVGTGSDFYYVDRFGFQQVSFEQQLRKQEESGVLESDVKDAVLDLYAAFDREYHAFLEKIKAIPSEEILKHIPEIYEMQEVYQAIRSNPYLSFDLAEDWNQLEHPLAAMRDVWSKTHADPSVDILSVYCNGPQTAPHLLEEEQQIHLTTEWSGHLLQL